MIHVSVIIPMYNAKEHIRETLNSLVVQTYNLFEVIVVNDGSTDKSVEIVNTFKSKLNINLISIPNKGAANARKLGIQTAKSDYIFFLDSDDLVPKNAINALYKEIIESDSDVVIGQNKILINQKSENSKPFELADNSVIKSFLLQKLPFTLWSSLYKKELFDNLNFYEKFIVGEDFLINCQIFSNEKIKVSVINEDVYIYRRHINSLTKKNDPQKTAQNFKAYITGINIIESKNHSNLDNEFIYNKLVFLYSLMVISSNDVEILIRNIKIHKRNQIKSQIKKLNFKMSVILYSIIFLNIPYQFIQSIINFLKKIK